MQKLCARLWWLCGLLFMHTALASGGLPAMEAGGSIFEVEVAEGVSYADVVDSLKALAEGENFVNPAVFPLGEHMKLRGQDPGGPLEVHALCNLSLGAEIMLDHPQYSVFAPCRVAIYQKQGRLYIGLARPTFDLKSIRQPTARAQKAAQELEDVLIRIIQRASRGDF